VETGELVDGYPLAVVYDPIHGTEYVTLPYDQPHQRFMKANF
jgi:hypothetical protein